MSSTSPAYAGLRLRLIAFALDYLLVFLYLIVLAGIGLAVTLLLPDLADMRFGNALSGQLTGFLLITLPLILYFTILESSPQQATWGKRRMSLRVTGPGGERLKRSRALIRSLLKFIPWELGHTCIWQIRFAGDQPSPLIAVGFVLVYVLIGANLVWLWQSATNQTRYDRLLGTFVVREQPVARRQPVVEGQLRRGGVR